MDNLAPVVLFTYKRFETLKKTIQYLSANFLASDSDLIIYSDGPKSIVDVDHIKNVREYLKTISGFKSVTIYESNINIGLANSIIKGVTLTLKKYNKIIVLEDDIITSTNFLSFMNASLNNFTDEKKIFSISGYSFNFSITHINHNGYFLNRPNSWGWAIWKDRWEMINWQLPFLSHDEINEFIKLGSDLRKMYNSSINNTIDSWHIKFIYNQFKFSGLTYYPTISKTNNIGFDEYATHTIFGKKRFITSLDLNNNTIFSFPSNLEIDKMMEKKLLFKVSLINRIFYKILNTLNLLK